MNIVTTIAEVKQRTEEARNQGKTIGFVPTMGFLHEGHASLMKRARQECDFVVVSIFVNPLQFGPNEDFERYPRDEQRDRALAQDMGVDLLFCPTVEEMYPRASSVTVNVHKRVDVLCGKSRVGHFDGVATVLVKLFNIVGAHRVYFGSKDAQQAAVVQGLIEDFNIPVTLALCETVREQDGLAKSSRNVYLSQQERDQASLLYATLTQAATRLQAGENVQTIAAMVEAEIRNQTSGTLDYFEILSYPSLEQNINHDERVILAIAVQFSKARLIDNLIVSRQDQKEEGIHHV
ncbi:pantoate--beta-alanine ligase [Fictibacillus macauensis ZFHKF-1]|uniref:Pantothenate synthetase n=1 Tax=Fictibacillus macauensis ZFHKF-1 TaxID=1196324 RepID=I8UIG9_9BACL|nr:pantoate--beta-alanine ligase [Fictibacillus macauensis]EIT86618.1 pantoate--beta-alanine ligase [Fictibacillus macauensis ZFHKF-1]